MKSLVESNVDFYEEMIQTIFTKEWTTNQKGEALAEVLTDLARVWSIPMESHDMPTWLAENPTHGQILELFLNTTKKFAMELNKNDKEVLEKDFDEIIKQISVNPEGITPILDKIIPILDTLDEKVAQFIEEESN
ncbi:hypothetical protein [Thermoactinomyces sp. DSM 45892]|uniref:hypothetical protein n=1 Tax=Thermoactinomyces sp. DSM 45892 TaxID=1882753 RepID=UPI00089A3F0D|nr:hypothetical protein [Thermoactinomyces sp. DSM 45892]SDY86989.1 hypothetical protein SAMN05444416_109124 [Thermoactinomyces sp. DSM 45892]